MQLAIIQDFIATLPDIRSAVDAMPPSPAKTFQAYTTGIERSHAIVVRLAASATLRRLAFLALTVADLLDVKEGLGRNRGKFSAVLSKGELPVESVMVWGLRCCPPPPPPHAPLYSPNGLHQHAFRPRSAFAHWTWKAMRIAAGAVGLSTGGRGSVEPPKPGGDVGKGAPLTGP